MTSKTLAAGLIITWLIVLLASASHFGNKPLSPDNIDETNLEFRLYV